jgi:hypothetical protein
MPKYNISRQENPPAGDDPAFVVGVIPVTVEDKRGRKDHGFKLVIELAAKKKNGQRFLVEKTYPLNTRGKSRLQADLKQWRGGKEPTQEDLEGFDPEIEFLNKPCVVPVSIVHENGKQVPHVGSLMPAGEVKTEPSGNYLHVSEGPKTTEDPAHAGTTGAIPKEKAP